MAIQRVIQQGLVAPMPSPFGDGTWVLTLACGHLSSWRDNQGPIPRVINCVFCSVHDSSGEAMKRFLVFHFEEYYPGGGWQDFEGAFDTLEEALGAFPHATQVVDLQTLKIVHGFGS